MERSLVERYCQRPIQGREAAQLLAVSYPHANGETVLIPMPDAKIIAGDYAEIRMRETCLVREVYQDDGNLLLELEEGKLKEISKQPVTKQEMGDFLTAKFDGFAFKAMGALKGFVESNQPLLVEEEKLAQAFGACWRERMQAANIAFQETGADMVHFPSEQLHKFADEALREVRRAQTAMRKNKDDALTGKNKFYR